MSDVIDRWAIANWGGTWPTVRRVEVLVLAEEGARVRSGDGPNRTTIDVPAGWVFEEEWRALDALADLHRVRRKTAMEHSAAAWVESGRGGRGKRKPKSLRTIGGA